MDLLNLLWIIVVGIITNFLSDWFKSRYGVWNNQRTLRRATKKVDKLRAERERIAAMIAEPAKVSYFFYKQVAAILFGFVVAFVLLVAAMGAYAIYNSPATIEILLLGGSLGAGINSVPDIVRLLQTLSRVERGSEYLYDLDKRIAELTPGTNPPDPQP